ncbi:MAG: hypothetical protein LBP82_03055 [Candidatus Methanoplasma sp.]|jgi:hypothetical protein|nr:hypothetical protein [Candidatus Methanoplasma sp.]
MKGTVGKVAVVLMAAAFAGPAIALFTSSESEGANEFTSYYDQLDANGKAIFDAVRAADADTRDIAVGLPFILSARSDNKEDAQKYVIGLVENSINAAFAALRLSAPMAYWGWGPSRIEDTYNITFAPDNTVSVVSVSFSISVGSFPVDKDTGEPPDIQKMLDDLDAAVKGFSTSNTTVRGKVLDINNYLVKLVTYDPNMGKDDESRFAHDAYGALADSSHYAVCDGYSKAFLLLCEKEGIECVVVNGTSLKDKINHAWNYVKLDNGKWYGIDVTWNDGSNNAHFLRGSDVFFSTHHQGTFLETGELPYPFKSPPISKTDYDTDNAWYLQYSWVLAAAIVALISIVIYRQARGRI